MFRFSLKSMLLAVFVINAGLSAAVGTVRAYTRYLDRRSQRLTVEGLNGIGEWERNRSMRPGWLEVIVGPEAERDVISVTLVGNTVTDAEIGEIRKLKYLREVSLIGTRVSDRGLQELQALKHLTVLDLSGTPVSDQSVIHLAQMTQLKTLRLKYNLKKDCPFAEWEEAFAGDPTRTEVSHECIQELNHTLVNTKIYL